MRFWSEGLGDRQLVMGLGRARIERQGEVMMLSGVVDSPAPWEYEVKIQREDWNTILATAVRPETCGFIARRASLAQLIVMVWAIVRFIILLAWFRAARVLTARLPTAAPAADSAKVLAAGAAPAPKL